MANVIGEFVAKIGADMKGFEQGIGSADKKMGGFAANFEKHRQAIAIGITALGASMLALSAMTIKAASGAEEMIAKFDVVFGSAAADVKAWAKETAAAMGRSRFAFMEMAASVQDTFVPMGFARDQAAELSKQLTELAVDVASFNNKVDTDVMRDFQSALVGNTETVRKYGIVLTAASVEQEILNQGWVSSKSEITEAMKVQARLNLIMQGTTDAQGDAARTALSFANQMKNLAAQIEEVKIALGDHLLPVVTPLVGKMADVVTAIKEMTDAEPALTKSFVLLAAGVGILMVALGPLLLVLPGIAAALVILQISLTGLLVIFGLFAVLIGTIVLASMQLAENAKREEYAIRLHEEHAKAIQGLDNEYAELLKESERYGFILDEEARAYIEASEAQEQYTLDMEKYKKKLEETTAAANALREAETKRDDAIKMRQQAEIFQHLVQAPGDWEKWYGAGGALAPGAKPTQTTIIMDNEVVGEIMMRGMGEGVLTQQRMVP